MTRNGGTKMHGGIDILVPKGAPIYAAHDGKVLRDGEELGGGGFGLRTYLDGGEGTVTIYAHLSGQHVFQGATVRRGMLLGWAGDSGNADMTGQDETPNHLHFEVHVDGKRVDPLEWLLELEAPDNPDANLKV
jgi:murein DD-endopeptidase MepM/ murein hydrolase activator NlpD